MLQIARSIKPTNPIDNPKGITYTLTIKGAKGKLAVTSK